METKKRGKEERGEGVEWSGDVGGGVAELAFDERVDGDAFHAVK